MFSVSREIDFCYGHRLLDYRGKCRHLHGHNGKAVITIDSCGLDQRGMVLDFAEIKRVVHRWIDENLDHRMILRRDDPVVAALKEAGEPMCLLESNPTAENIAKLIFDFAVGQGYPVVEVRFWETPGCFATYCRERRTQVATAPVMVNADPAPTRLSEVERATILATLEECSGNRTQAAKKLGISRRTLIYKLRAIEAHGGGVAGVERSEPPDPGFPGARWR